MRITSCKDGKRAAWIAGKAEELIVDRIKGSDLVSSFGGATKSDSRTALSEAAMRPIHAALSLCKASCSLAVTTNVRLEKRC